jgi:N-acetylmuramoyl-L-alanine amidase
VHKNSKLKTVNILLMLPAALFLNYCSPTNIVKTEIPVYEYPTDWKDLVIRNKTISEYSKYLSGRIIFLDPGHGGEDRKNKNNTGDVIEADVNLRVTLNLKKYLETAGAKVILSREEDKTVKLADRSELSNSSGAELFISIHHNAPSSKEDIYSDYTAVYYHARENDSVYEPCNHDIARFIERDLSYVMHNPGGLGSFDGTYSDYNIYPKDGFSVLRKSKIPAVLAECGFHTSRFEDLRLNKEEFNQIQAWGIFRGLAKYFKAGKPEIVFLPDSMAINNHQLKLAFGLIDSSKIDPKSIHFFFNNDDKEFTFNKLTSILKLTVNDVNPGKYPVRIIAENKNGNHTFPYHKSILISDSANVKFQD